MERAVLPMAPIARRARELGLCAVGAAPAVPGREGRRLERFVEEGRHGRMRFLERHRDVRGDPRRLVPGARSVLVVAASYAPPLDEAPGADPDRRRAGWGSVARYARCVDYHEVLLPAVRELAAGLGDPAARATVDAGPVMEKVWAARAGLGWIGRQTHLISRAHGAFLVLGSIVTRAVVEPAAPARDLCGRCTRCIDACPTGALARVSPGETPRMDARRCRSYLTIERRGSLPEELRPALGDALFGCDRCVDACPWNRFAGDDVHPELRPRLPARLDAASLLALDGHGFRGRFARTPVLRARRRGLLRNAAVVLGNGGDPAAVPPLCRCLDGEADPVVRGHACWALGRLGGAAARAALERAAAGDPDGDVRREARAALDRWGAAVGEGAPDENAEPGG